MRLERFPIVLVLLCALSLATVPMFGQSLTTGNITGTVVDPSHAVIPGAPVELKGTDTGSSASTTTNSNGGFSFGLLKPGHYEVLVKQAGFAEGTRRAPKPWKFPGRRRLLTRSRATTLHLPKKKWRSSRAPVATSPTSPIPRLASLSTEPAVTETSPPTACRPRRTCSPSTVKTTWTRTSTPKTRVRRTLRWDRTKSAKLRLSPTPTADNMDSSPADR